MVTIEQVKELRDRTGISITACKKALEEVGGDMDKAIELLRKKGEAKAAERSERTTGEGFVAVAGDSMKKAMVLLACETDFVARGEDFVAAAQKFADTILTQGVAADFGSEVTDLGIKLGEKIELNDKALVEGPVVGSYIHSNNKIGVLVVLSEGGNEEQAVDVALHIAAMNPKYTTPEEVDDAMVAKEREIWTDQLKQEGKPEQIMAGILAGKEKKFRGEAALMTQPFVKNPEQTVADYLGDVKVLQFVNFRV